VSKAAESDNLEDAVNYQLIYNVIREEMEIPSNLLEHVCGRILKRMQQEFPALVTGEISIAKLNPPIGGQVGAFKCTMSYGE
jgi:dihydroneopterin aldolase